MAQPRAVKWIFFGNEHTTLVRGSGRIPETGDAGNRCEARHVYAVGSFAVGRRHGVVSIWLRQCCLG